MCENVEFLLWLLEITPFLPSFFVVCWFQLFEIKLSLLFFLFIFFILFLFYKKKETVKETHWFPSETYEIGFVAMIPFEILSNWIIHLFLFYFSLMLLEIIWFYNSCFSLSFFQFCWFSTFCVCSCSCVCVNVLFFRIVW